VIEQMIEHFQVKVQRQKDAKGAAYSETFDVEYEPGMNMTTVLQRIAAMPKTVEGKDVAPVAYDACCLEEVCGACTMVINGRVRQACSTLIENIYADHVGPIEVRPMTKFPVVRDLVVDRGRMFENLKRIRGWVHVDDYLDRGPGPRTPPKVQEEVYPLSRCMTCGCCVEACPQFGDHSPFIGPAAVSMAIYFNANPIGAMEKDERLAVLAAKGGIADCGNSQNCVKVCPKEIPLTDSIAKAGRDTTLYKLRTWFGR